MANINLRAVEANKQTKRQTKSPANKFAVYLINDDYTPMDFVVFVLQEFFNMAYPRAIQVMLKVHQTGDATCGVYRKEIAETKVAQVNHFAREDGYPLLCKMKRI